jgi:hypothetical protein
MDKIKLGQGFNVLPQSKYFMFMDVFCKCKKLQVYIKLLNQKQRVTSTGYLCCRAD